MPHKNKENRAAYMRDFRKRIKRADEQNPRVVAMTVDKDGDAKMLLADGSEIFHENHSLRFLLVESGGFQ